MVFRKEGRHKHEAAGATICGDATLAHPMCNNYAVKNSLVDRWKMDWESLCAVLVEE
jgi:hypothetical protein